MGSRSANSKSSKPTTAINVGDAPPAPFKLLSGGRCGSPSGPGATSGRFGRDQRRFELCDLVEQVVESLVLVHQVCLDLLRLMERRVGVLVGHVGALVRTA